LRRFVVPIADFLGVFKGNLLEVVITGLRPRAHVPEVMFRGKSSHWEKLDPWRPGAAQHGRQGPRIAGRGLANGPAGEHLFAKWIILDVR
jgi:hypothetical protein